MGTRLIQGTRVALTKGDTYRARVRIDKPRFLVSDGAIVAYLEDEGFQDVKIWRDVATLPDDWPADERGVSTGLSDWTAFIEATWSRPDEVRKRPEPLLALWLEAAAREEPSGGVLLPEVIIEADPGVLTTQATKPSPAPSSSGGAELGTIAIGVVAGILAATKLAPPRHEAGWGVVMLGGVVGGALAIALGARWRPTVSGGA